MSNLPDCEYRRAFQARDYLRQYYSRPELSSDDVLLVRELCAWLRRLNHPVSTALDFGCGPVLHYAFAVAPFARRIELAEYLPDNREEVRKWWQQDPDAHNWDPLFSGVLGEEGTSLSELDSRAALLREQMQEIHPCDLRQEHPLGKPLQFDVITSFFCTECVASTLDEWEQLLTRLLNLVAPGGSVFLAACRNATHYNVLGQHFRAVPVTEQEISRVVLRNGFNPQSLVSTAIPSPAWQDDGFDHISVVAATRHT